MNKFITVVAMLLAVVVTGVNAQVAPDAPSGEKGYHPEAVAIYEEELALAKEEMEKFSDKLKHVVDDVHVEPIPHHEASPVGFLQKK